MIEKIGTYVLRTAVEEASHWPDHIRIAVNLSPIQFNNPAIVATVAAALTDPVERATAAGLVALVMERRTDGIASLRTALALDPNAYEARIALLRVERARVVAGDPEMVALAASVGDPMAL